MQYDGNSVAIAAGEASITFSPPAAFAERFAPFGQECDAAAPRLAALRVRTESLERTRAVLDEHGVRHVATARDSLLVAAHDACGAVLEFTAR